MVLNVLSQQMGIDTVREVNDAWAGIVGAVIGVAGTLVVTALTGWQAGREKTKDREAEEARWRKQRQDDEARWHADRAAEEDRWKRDRQHEADEARRREWAEDRKRVYLTAATASLRWRELMSQTLALRGFARGGSEGLDPYDTGRAKKLDAELSSAVSELSIIAEMDLRNAAHELTRQLTFADAILADPVNFDLKVAKAAYDDTSGAYSLFLLMVRRDLGISESDDERRVREDAAKANGRTLPAG